MKKNACKVGWAYSRKCMQEVGNWTFAWWAETGESLKWVNSIESVRRVGRKEYLRCTESRNCVRHIIR